MVFRLQDRHVTTFSSLQVIHHGLWLYLASVQEQMDFTTPWGKLTSTMLGMLAEIYIDNVRHETRKGKIQRARDGYFNGNILLVDGSFQKVILIRE